MLEEYALYVVALGVLLAVVGFLWLIVRAFRHKVLWGLALIIFPPAGLLFIVRHFRKAIAPVCVLVLASVVIGAPYAVSYYKQHFIPLKPYEQIVNGELRITLTELKDFDYATLKEKPQTVVLQMANPDVDDRVLENLKGMQHLQELDLNGTQVTDQGLATLATLPQLKTLRLARTRITDEGFRSHLFARESLVHLDLTGTQVKSKTKRDWKKQKPEQREYVD
jgi:hypothetical protein